MKLGDSSNVYNKIVNAAEHPHLSIPEQTSPPLDPVTTVSTTLQPQIPIHKYPSPRKKPQPHNLALKHHHRSKYHGSVPHDGDVIAFDGIDPRCPLPERERGRKRE